MWFDDEDEKYVMEDREDSGHGQRILCTGGIDFNV